MFIKYNPNPSRLNVGDCVIRSITSATGDIWENVYIELALQGYMMHDMPSANRVRERTEKLSRLREISHILHDIRPSLSAYRANYKRKENVCD